MADVSQLCQVLTSDAKRFIAAAADNKMVYEEKSSATSPVQCSDTCQRSILSASIVWQPLLAKCHHPQFTSLKVLYEGSLYSGLLKSAIWWMVDCQG